jgi:hypothetical protein
MGAGTFGATGGASDIAAEMYDTMKPVSEHTSADAHRFGSQPSG